MKNFKRIISFFLAVVILMMHALTIFHTLDHNDNNLENQKLETSSLIFDFDKSSNLSELCNICDMYFNAELEELKTSNYAITTSQIILSKIILQQEAFFTPLVLDQKQSRAPLTKLLNTKIYSFNYIIVIFYHTLFLG
ncbi:hypothetical protein JL193_03385 [Polaribacter batillariae]|uniref:Uncharacterized protein n=1 Tax=Polaribacter batillariae TaxID=2808900 RepID=A0ABX7SZB8_9FLAO|nr:hypothetical protein [Polaribacter batillariae]QTD38356.1 hypothetical protein JL193_03385 [Polaribacter batillariae]